MIEASVIKNNITTETFFALNDVVIAKCSFSRIIHLKTYINEQYIDTYSADGLIVSTPTGSTAYSLSAGGPILSPDISGMVITPISPHALNSRSIVISDKESVKVEVVGNQSDIMLTIDGQQGYRLNIGDVIKIKEADYATNLVRLKGKNFYDVMRKKLHERHCSSQ